MPADDIKYRFDLGVSVPLLLNAGMRVNASAPRAVRARWRGRRPPSAEGDEDDEDECHRVGLCLDHRAYPSAAAHDGFSALHAACQGGRSGAVKQLLHAGAAINARTTTSEQTPLMLAAGTGDWDTAKALLKASKRYGPRHVLDDIAAVDARGRSAADNAERHGHVALAAKLRKAGRAQAKEKERLSRGVEALRADARKPHERGLLTKGRDLRILRLSQKNQDILALTRIGY